MTGVHIIMATQVAFTPSPFFSDFRTDMVALAASQVMMNAANHNKIRAVIGVMVKSMESELSQFSQAELWCNS